MIKENNKQIQQKVECPLCLKKMKLLSENNKGSMYECVCGGSIFIPL